MVAGHVLPEVGELQAGADRIGKITALPVVAFEEMERDPSHRVRGAGAVIEQLIECVVVPNALILLKSGEEVIEVFHWNGESFDRRLECDRDRMCRHFGM